eukprot:353262-Chlamydomonas_euryale.AAC.3
MESPPHGADVGGAAGVPAGTAGRRFGRGGGAAGEGGSTPGGRGRVPAVAATLYEKLVPHLAAAVAAPLYQKLIPHLAAVAECRPLRHRCKKSWFNTWWPWLSAGRCGTAATDAATPQPSHHTH